MRENAGPGTELIGRTDWGPGSRELPRRAAERSLGREGAVVWGPGPWEREGRGTLWDGGAATCLLPS